MVFQCEQTQLFQSFSTKFMIWEDKTMEDSTTMTIEFLRARLLSERSVSRTAKQRADELAKKVVELEEQLKTVTLQGKKTEKATVEVLAILENNGISDFSEAFDSNSDEDRLPCDCKEDTNSKKEEEGSVTSRRSNEAEEILVSELEGSPSSGGNLSWKSSTNSKKSLEKKKSIDQSKRRECNFVFTSGSSTKPRVGKSCRQIKPREIKSASNEVRYESFMFDSQEDGGTIGMENGSKNIKDRSEITKEGSENGDMLLADSGSVEDEQKEARAGLDLNGSKTHSDMQKAVENQAQFIDQNAAQENAQREWEEKFKENVSRNLDSSEHGNQSDITEERDDIREAAEPADIISSHSQSAKSEGEEASIIDEEINKMTANGSSSVTSLAIVCSQDQEQNGTSVNEAGAVGSEFSFLSQESPRTTVSEKEKQDWPDTLSIGSSGYKSTKKLSFQTDGSQAYGDSSGSQNELQIEVWQEPPKELGVVLEELQRVKLSLKHELNRSSSLKKAWPPVRTTATSVPAIEAGDKAKIPVGFSGLFRIPTDKQLVSATESNMFGSHSNLRLDLTRYSPNIGGHRSDPYRTSPNLEMGLRDSLQRPCFDPYMDVGMVLPASSKFTCPSYADFMPGDGVFRSFPSFRQEMPVNDRYSLYNENLASNIRHQISVAMNF